MIVLAEEPKDDFGVAADRLRQMSTDGLINVLGVGISCSVSDATIIRLANIPLRVEQANGQTVQCFRWLPNMS